VTTLGLTSTGPDLSSARGASELGLHAVVLEDVGWVDEQKVHDLTMRMLLLADVAGVADVECVM
jgi:hypothetical protein